MSNSAFTTLRKFIITAICIALTAGYAGAADRSPMSDASRGYLTSATAPDSAMLLPPPPATGSAALALDEEISRDSQALKDSPRWALATMDADLTFPAAAGAFSCALNAPVTEQDTPHLYNLLRRVFADTNQATSRAKKKYMRSRPFVANGKPSCSPKDEQFLKTNGSYPSGHSAAGWAWALLLAEIAPDRADAILARGRAFGQSRVICNVHWESDVMEGRFMGAATVARLHGDPAFRADLEAARAELAAVRAKGAKPARDCKAEAAALAEIPPNVPWPANR
ncbi:MAG TPA: phosphatase PAP2 family protein [Geobacteraceae bacterium]|nr:phosphatase PAP2 family protein [Geobacteraceae bacterium]